MCIIDSETDIKAIQFYCDQSCITFQKICNFIVDCSNLIDEQNCFEKDCCLIHKNNSNCKILFDYSGNVIFKPGYPYLTNDYCKPQNCSWYEYKCHNEGFCIDMTFVCDGINHCLFGDDEMNCDNFLPKGFFKCKNQKLFLPPHQLCDGILHCKHASDELNCLNEQKYDVTTKICFYPSKLIKIFLQCNLQKKFNFNSSFIINDNLKYLKFNGTIINSTKIHKKLNLIELSILKIENNGKLNEFIKLNCPNLIKLEIINSKPGEWNIFINKNFSILQILNLTKSNFYNLKKFENSNTKKLIKLILTKTKISIIKSNEFNSFNNLKYLELKYLRIKKIEHKAIQSFKNIEILDIKYGYLELKESS